MTFIYAKKKADELSQCHQALYLAVDDGDNSSFIRLDDFVTSIHIYDGRRDRNVKVEFMGICGF